MKQYHNKLKGLLLLINFALGPSFCSCLSQFSHCWGQIKELVKVKPAPLRAKLAKRKDKGTLPSILDPAARKGWVVSATPQSL